MIVSESSVRPSRRAPRRRAKKKLDDVASWARTADESLSLSEAEARLVRRDRVLTSTVLSARRTPEDPGPDGPYLHVKLRIGLRPLRGAFWAALLTLPALPLMVIPRRSSSGRAAAAQELSGRFFDAVTVAYLLAIGVQLLFLLAWLVRPARAHMERLVSAVSILFMIPGVLFGGLIREMRGGMGERGEPILIVLGAAVLAIGSLFSFTSLRSLEHAHARDVRRIRAALREDSEWCRRTKGPRGPVTALGRAVWNLEEHDRKALRRNGARVLRALEDRKQISAEAARAAGELPLGQWHELES